MSPVGSVANQDFATAFSHFGASESSATKKKALGGQHSDAAKVGASESSATKKRAFCLTSVFGRVTMQRS